MSVELSIDDGNPWYLSPDIWVVPGNDPNGPIGMPVAHKPAYVWVRVNNRGTAPVSNAVVRYYWADPSTAVTVSTANLIGVSYVSLNPGEEKDVLCLSPWIPTWANNGHECLIAEAFSVEDPLPQRGAGDTFDVPNDRHVAQRNISVIYASSMVIHPFIVGGAPQLRSEEVTLRARQAPMELLIKLKRTIGLEHIPRSGGKIREFGLQPFHCGDQIQNVGKPKCTLKTGSRQSMALAIKLPETSRTQTGTFFLIEQLSGRKVVGGIGILVLHSGKNSREKNR